MEPIKEEINDLEILQNHVEELIDQYFNGWAPLYDMGKKNKKIVIKFYRYFWFDPRRFWAIASVWFEGKPVMLIQNAGREGDDYHKRFITDQKQFESMCNYLTTLNPQTYVPGSSDIYSADDDQGDLGSFYGENMDTTRNIY
jgi:hypothetical protein